jgi:DNA-binding CsgD family transcriptional regulator
MQILEASYKVHDTLGQAGPALAYFKKYVTLRDTLMSVEKSKRIEELSIRIELFQKNEENLLLKQDMKTQKLKNWVLAGLSFFGFLISLLIIVILVQKRKNLLLKKSEAEQEHLLQKIEIENIRLENKMKEEELEKSQMEVQMKEQDLIFQTLLRLDLTQVNKSVQEKLLPFQYKFTSRSVQNDFVMAINEIVRDTGKDPLADFEFMFSQLHKSFIDNLMAHCSSLSRIELQVCSLLRINLSTKDIARLLNISMSGVDMCRHRIRQKLGLDPKDNLSGFLITL